MSNLTYRTLGFTDQHLIAALQDLERAHPDLAPINVQSASIGDYSPPAFQSPQSLEEFAKSPITQQLLSADSVTLNISVGLQPNFTVASRHHAVGFTEITIGLHPTKADPRIAAVVVTEIQKRFPPYSKPEAIEKMLGPHVAQAFAHRDAGLNRLEELTQKIFRENIAYRKSLDEERLAFQAQLQEEFSAKRTALDAEHSEQSKKLQQRLDELEAEQKKWDDRQSRHVRRDLREKLKASIEARGQNFALSPATQQKRRAIHLIFVALLALSGALVTWGLRWPHVTTTNAWSDIVPLFRLPLGALGFALTAIFYIRWNDHWFRQHADEEFRLKQLDLDIDRASWVVEMALEWQGEKDAQIPTDLVEKLSQGLFDRTGGGRPKHPTEDVLSALLGASSDLKVTLPGKIEAALNRRGVKRFHDATHGEE